MDREARAPLPSERTSPRTVSFGDVEKHQLPGRGGAPSCKRRGGLGGLVGALLHFSTPSTATSNHVESNIREECNDIEDDRLPTSSSQDDRLPTSSSQDLERVQSLKSRLSFQRPQTHQLPFHIIWGITLLVAVGMAFANFSITWVVLFMNKGRFLGMQAVADSAGPVPAAVALTAMSMALGAAAGGVVTAFSPVCAGGGLPEMRSFLNGNEAGGLFSVRTLLVRYLGTILGVAAGFPMGREGPTISIGCTIGVGVTKLLAMPHMRRRVNLGAEGHLPAVMVDEERLAHAKRIGCAMGGAAGMATIFNAPIGGLLYMFEEVTVTNWDHELTFRAFVCTVASCILSRAMLNLCGANVRDFLIITYEPSQYSWHWVDIPFFMLLGALLGACSGAYGRALVRVWSLRKRAADRLGRWSKGARVLECALYAGVCAMAFSLVSLAAGCRAESEAPGGVESMRFNCPEGEYNPVASLLITAPEEAIKQAYSFTGADLKLYELSIATAAYAVFNVGIQGLPVPIGTFIPTMLLGSFAGRAFGQALGLLHLRGLAQDAIFALVGSAAMLGGFTHQTMSIVVFLVECVSDLTLISPLMVTIFAAHLASKLVNPEGFHELIAVEKDVPYLDPDLPDEVERRMAQATAADLCSRVETSAVLAPEASVQAVRSALRGTAASSFPIVSEAGTFVGLITRRRLQAALDACPCQQAAAESADGGDVEEGTPGADAAVLPIHRIMDPAPSTVLEKTPAPRLYPLFAKSSADVACVISEAGQFRGLLPRTSLIDAARGLRRAGSFGTAFPEGSANTSRLQMGSPSAPSNFSAASPALTDAARESPHSLELGTAVEGHLVPEG